MTTPENLDDQLYANTQAWMQVRCGKPTGSRAGDIMGRLAPKWAVVQDLVDSTDETAPIGVHSSEAAARKQAEAQKKAGYNARVELREGAKTGAWEAYLVEKLAERVTGNLARHAPSAAMLWGLNHEDAALAHYSVITGNEIERGYWVDRGEWGCTPDGFVVGLPVIVSIKCPQQENFVKAVRTGIVEHDHYWQAVAEMAANEWAERVDLALYHPETMLIEDRMIIRRIYRKHHEAQITRFLASVDEFSRELDAAKEQWNQRVKAIEAVTYEQVK